MNYILQIKNINASIYRLILQWFRPAMPSFSYSGNRIRVTNTGASLIGMKIKNSQRCVQANC